MQTVWPIWPPPLRAAPYSADLSDHAAVQDVIAAIIADHGTPTVLVWNAALWDETPPLALDPAEFDRQLRLGLTSALTAAQALRLGTVTIAGQVAPGTAFDPDRIATAFWALHDSADAKIEHVFDGS